MIEAGLDLHFAQKPADKLLLIGLLMQQNLHRLEPPGENVFYFENAAHPARAEYPDNLVITDGIARPEGHSVMTVN
jgi:hypothetical protein